MIYGAWIPVTDRLPPVGLPVLVKGRYTPPGYGYPTARIAEHNGVHPSYGLWISRESRGMVGITHWFEEITD